MKRNGKKPNGSPNGHANGHTNGGGRHADSAEHEFFTTSTKRDHVPIGRGVAASDEACGGSVAGAANSQAACAARNAYAEAAMPRPRGTRSKPEAPQKTPEERLEIAVRNGLGGSGAFVADIADSAAFVNAVTARVDMMRVTERMLLSEDEKIAQRAWERMLDMKFGKAGAQPSEEAAPIILDLPRPER